jgi:hypothetical protein
VDKVASLDRKTRADLFRESGARIGDLSPVVIEKDFWVCWLLKQLFTIPELNGWLVFKGGTSLSKCFNLIRRFSEDIDLAVDFERLGYVGERDPRRADLSHTRRGKLLEELQQACQGYISGPFLTALKNRVDEILVNEGWSLAVSEKDANTVEFTYPSALETTLAYIKPQAVMELGTHAEPIPRDVYSIRPFAADHFPKLFKRPACEVTTVMARRTFWEKATILHAEYHRPLDKPMLPRYSRHYADVAEMSRHDVKHQALQDLDLLHQVCLHKDRFYHCGWAHYLDAVPGSFHLVPPNKRISALRRDYQAMQVMFYDQASDFDAMLQILGHLEQEINAAN